MNIIHCLTDGIKSRVTKHTRKTKHKSIADYAFSIHTSHWTCNMAVTSVTINWDITVIKVTISAFCKCQWYNKNVATLSHSFVQGDWTKSSIICTTRPKINSLNTKLYECNEILKQFRTDIKHTRVKHTLTLASTSTRWITLASSVN